MNFDTINALFELGGSYCVWRNAFQLIKDQEIKGVYWPTWVFMTIWGLWNLFYYPSLGQWHSSAAGVILVSGNIAWLYVALKIKINELIEDTLDELY